MTPPLENFDLIFFGGTGDLAMRKLLPAMYYRFRDQQSPQGPQGWRIIGVARAEQTREHYIDQVSAHCRKFIPKQDFDAEIWAAFTEVVDYVSLDAGEAKDFAKLAAMLKGSESRVRVFYLSTAASLFSQICQNLAAAKLVTAASRVVMEKPLGRDRDSANEINSDVAKIFKEKQIFRIDHYLGKETVQNLMALRFSNSIFEPLWNRALVRDVQITLAEQVGVEGRGGYYDHYGAMRDMVQNHLLQLMCIVAMEPPSNGDPDAIRDEKLKILRSLRPFTPEMVRKNTVRGQYRAGAIDGNPVPGYLEEKSVPPDSSTETFVAIKAELDNWRWSGVPFFLRTGKRMQERISEIVVNFRHVPFDILPAAPGGENNRLVIQLQPEEGIKLYVLAKTPGSEMNVRPVALDLNFAEAFSTRHWDAYERLLTDVILGNLTLFMRRDELDAAWAWIDPIQNGWAEQGDRPKPYTSGTWGPTASSALIVRDGLAWSEES